MQLVPIITSEEVELALISMRIAWRTDERTHLQRQLSPLETAFHAFERRVAMQSGDLTTERDRLRHICAELEHYTTRLHARLEADPEGYLASVFTPDELRHIGTLLGVDVPESWFGEAEHTTTKGDGWYSNDDQWGPEENAQTEPLPSDEADELRTLYRQLARTFHPDLTEDERERTFRQEVMLRINHAWDLRDLHAMRTIGNDVKDLLAGKMLNAVAWQLAWHRRELASIDAECAKLRKRIEALRTSKTMALWHNPSLANAAIARHISRLQNEILELDARRESAMEEFRLALGAYSASR